MGTFSSPPPVGGGRITRLVLSPSPVSINVRLVEDGTTSCADEASDEDRGVDFVARLGTRLARTNGTATGRL